MPAQLFCCLLLSANRDCYQGPLTYLQYTVNWRCPFHSQHLGFLSPTIINDTTWAHSTGLINYTAQSQASLTKHMSLRSDTYICSN
jgi:hypothetical protein